MNEEFFKNQQSIISLVTLANAVELATSLTRDVSGGDIATRITGSNITLHELSVSEIRKNLKLGV